MLHSFSRVTRLGLLAPLLLFVSGTPAHAHEDCRTHLIPFTDSGKVATVQYNRDRPVDVRHIRLDLRVDVPAEHLEGSATHTLAAVGSAVQTVEFDSVGLDIHAVTLGDGRRVDFETTPNALKMHLPTPMPPGEEFTLKIDYGVTRPEKGMHFRTARMGYADAEVQCWSQGESEDARYWFPCYDATAERATTEIAATAASEFRAVSNGELVDMHENPSDGTRTFHYRLAKEHATYLVSLAVGHFVEIADDSGRVPLFYYVLPGQEDRARLSFGNTADMLAFYEDRLGVPYAWGRYSQVAVVDFIAGGMENSSITTLMDRALLDAPALLTNRSDWLVAHELAHQWFGDLLTCRDWTNIWLNEGWATYMDACYEEHAHGPDDYFHRMWDNASDVFSTDTPDKRLATVRKVWGDPEGLFDARVYEKGAWVLHMLRRQLGEDVFWKATQTYLEQHANQAVETNDLLRTYEAVSGVALEQFFDQWIYHAGWPEFKVAYSWDEERHLATVRVSQTQKTDDKTLLFKLRTTLRFAGDGFTRDEVVDISEKDHTFNVSLEKRPDFVRFDPNADLLKTLDFDRSKDMLLAQLAKDSTAAGRYEACAALGKMKDASTVAALRSAVENDGYWGVRARAVEALASMDFPEAKEAALLGLAQKDARVRLAAAKALKTVDTDTCRAALLERVQQDESPYVVAASIDSLAAQQATAARDTIKAAITRPSVNEVIRNAALRATARLAGDGAVDALLPHATMDAPRMARGTAIDALARAGEWTEDKTRARKALVGLLDAVNPGVRKAAIGGLRTLGDTRAVPLLEAFADATAQKDEAEAARDAVSALRKRETAPEAVGQLQERLDKLEKALESMKEEKKKVDERLDATEALQKKKDEK